jgi:hypothetical protein
MSSNTRLPALTGQVLEVLYQHRVATTGQLRALLTPRAADASYPRRCLRAGAAAGLVAAVRCGASGHRVWYLTGLGYTLVERSGHAEVIRRHRMRPELAAGGLLEHRLATVDTGAAFVAAARASGDECGPWSWMPEV